MRHDFLTWAFTDLSNLLSQLQPILQIERDEVIETLQNERLLL